MTRAREGGTVTVLALDRLGRSLPSIIKTIDDLQARGIVIKSLRDGVDFSISVGRLVAGIFANQAEYARHFIKERVAAAREAARARGRNTGQPPTLNRTATSPPGRCARAGCRCPLSPSGSNVSRATVYRALAQE